MPVVDKGLTETIPIPSKETKQSHLTDVAQLLEQIHQCERDIEKIEAKSIKLDESNNTGLKMIEVGLNRLKLVQKKADAMKMNAAGKEKNMLDAIKYWQEFGFEARELPPQGPTTSEHYEFIFTRLNKKQLRPIKIGIRLKEGKLDFLYSHPEHCLSSEVMLELAKQLNSADFNQSDINWRQTMLAIRKTLVTQAKANDLEAQIPETTMN